MATISWVATTGEWSVGSNWSTGTVPTGADDVFITSGQSYAVTVNTAAQAHSVTLNAGNVSLLVKSGSTLDVAADLTQANGTVQLDGMRVHGDVLLDGGFLGGSGFAQVAGNIELNGGTFDLQQGVLLMSGSLEVNGGTFDLSGVIEGGTIAAKGGVINYGTFAQLDNVAWLGLLTTRSTIEVHDSFNLRQLDGTTPGTVDVLAGGVMSIVNVGTVDHVNISLAGALTGAGAFGADTTINASGTHAVIDVGKSERLIDGGTITVAADGVLQIRNTGGPVDTFFPKAQAIILGQSATLEVEASRSVRFDPSAFRNVIAATGTAFVVVNATLNLRQGTLAPGANVPKVHAEVFSNGTVVAGAGDADRYNDLTWLGPLTGPVTFVNGLVVSGLDGTSPGVITTDYLLDRGSDTLRHMFINFTTTAAASGSTALLGEARNHTLTLDRDVITTVDIGNANTLALNQGILSNSGQIRLFSGNVTTGLQAFRNTGLLDISAGGASIDFTGAATFTNFGTIRVSNGADLHLGAADNAALIAVSDGATLDANGLQNHGTVSVGSGGTIDSLSHALGSLAFTQGSGFVLAAPTFTASVTGWVHDDNIGWLTSGGTYSFDAASTDTRLIVDRNGAPSTTIDIGPGYSLDEFSLVQRGSLTVIETTATAPCFVKGTRLMTDSGEVAVEDLRIGDRMRTHLTGRSQNIVWIGERTVDCRSHPNPARVWPVCITAGAFGPHLPVRTLFLSPDHAVYAHGVLIPVKHLINGATIAQVPMDQVTYYHVELPQHDVILAEELPVESYLDTGDRTDFANAGAMLRLHPEFGHNRQQAPAAWEAHGCARLAVSGPEVERTRQDIAEACELAARLPRPPHTIRTAFAA